MEQTTAGRWSRAFRAAFPATIPVLTGFLCLGLAYGVLMETKGYGPLWSTLMSAVAFGGSMQYVAITLLTTAFDPLQAFLLSVMVNAHHIFYGLSLLDKYKGLGKVRGFLIYVLCDETFPWSPRWSRLRRWSVAISIFVSRCWITAIGWWPRPWGDSWGIS